jgi:hypothetical protein
MKATILYPEFQIKSISMKIKFSLFFLLFAVAMVAQPSQNSPYSRFGIGDLLSQYFAAHTGFGGQAIAFHDPYHLSLVNPASYAFLRATTLEGGMYMKHSTYKTDTDAKNNWSGNLSYLALGFPLRSPINEVLDKRKSPWQFGMGIALTPYSSVGYNVFTRDTLPNLGDIQSSFEGTGGTYRFTWSNAVKYKNSAIGLNIGWLFGKNSYENSTFFIDSLPTFANTSRDDIRLNGLVWNLGVQHDFVLKYSENDKTLATRWVTVGLTGEGSHNIKSTADRIFLRSRGRLANGQYESADTLLFESGKERTVTLPAGFGLGGQYVIANKLRLGAQYVYEGWSSFKNEARPDGAEYRNTSAFSAGVEYIPDYSSYNNYAKRIRLRAGAYYRQDPRVIEGNGVNDLGLSVGFGFPVVLPRQQTSFINTSLEIGKLGGGTQVEETYYRITIGYTFNDNSWFYKRRFE